jgi:hypothetical protein
MMPSIIVTRDISLWDTVKSLFQIALFITAFIAINAVGGIEPQVGLLERQLATKSLTVHKSQVGNQIKRCEALHESTNGYHAGNWRIEVSDKGVSVECVQESYRVPR